MGRIEKTVFISYRRTNLPWALFIWQNLTIHGYDVFFDYQSIDSGSFEKVILENIKARAHFIVILTPSALERCKNPGDWLRREIETAIDEKRNIVPLMMEGFDFGSPFVKEALTGKLAVLSGINALQVPEAYAVEAMDRLRERFLKISLNDVVLPTLTEEAQEVTISQQVAANKATSVSKEQLTAQTWFERGYLYYENRNFEEAIRCYSEAIILDPSLAKVYNNLGVLYVHMKRYEEAETALRKAIELKPSDNTFNDNLKLLMRISELDADYTEKKLQLKEAKLQLAESKQKIENILTDFYEAVKLNPTDIHAYKQLIFMLRLAKRSEEAFPLLEKIIEIDQKDFGAYLSFASINKELGRGFSRGNINKARRLIPEDDWYNRACLESVCDDFDLAFNYLEKATKTEGFDPAWAWIDPDLQWVREDPRFVEIAGPKPI